MPGHLGSLGEPVQRRRGATVAVAAAARAWLLASLAGLRCNLEGVQHGGINWEGIAHFVELLFRGSAAVTPDASLSIQFCGTVTSGTSLKIVGGRSGRRRLWHWQWQSDSPPQLPVFL
jgi:hypothetical protein